VTLRAMLRPACAGAERPAALEKFKAVMMIDVHLPTSDGRTIISAAPHPARSGF